MSCRLVLFQSGNEPLMFARTAFKSTVMVRVGDDYLLDLDLFLNKGDPRCGTQCSTFAFFSLFFTRYSDVC